MVLFVLRFVEAKWGGQLEVWHVLICSTVGVPEISKEDRHLTEDTKAIHTCKSVPGMSHPRSYQ